jgi:glutamate-1-semialdehyde aminotransferase
LQLGRHHALLARGVLHFPLACKQGSISAAHTDEDLSFSLEATRDALASL